MSKIEAEVKLQAGEAGSDIDPLDFDNLDLTDVKIGTFSPEDKVYLEKFTKVDNMIMLGCELTSLENFPNLPELKRLELSENEFKGSDLVHLQKLKELICLNLNGNKIDTMAELAHLKDLPLTTLEVTGNPVSELVDFQKKGYELFTKLEALDGLDKEGNIVDDYDDEMEGEEEDMDEEAYFERIKASLTEDERKEIEAKGMTFEQYMDGQAGDLEEFDSDEVSDS